MTNHTAPRVLGQGGRFAIERELGRGEFAVVYLAHDRKRDETVALRLLERRALRRVGLERIQREFELATTVRHPNLARHYELLSDEGDWFFVMELVEGHDFVEHVRRDLADDGHRATRLHFTAYGQPQRTRDSSEFEPCTAAGLVRLREALPQLISAVSAIHDAHLVHCDLQPANVRVTYEGRVVVLDYGLATVPEAAGVPGQPAPVGAPTYMAPEQWDRAATGPASDWYAVGVILFETLTGAPPFVGTGEELVVRKRTVDAPRPSQLVDGVPDDLDQLVSELLRIAPEQRPRGEELLRRFGP
jgi:serine/threonine protein kinase